MKPIRSHRIVQPPTTREEHGITMVLTLFMGLILISGITGLMIRQIIARKLGASESYQQMAENAAINGFNRILGEVNRDDRTKYKGYFLTLRNDEQGWGWRNPNSTDFPLIELCTDTSLSLTADPLSDSTEAAKPVLLSSANDAIASQREDGKDNIQLYYRLRGYALSGDGSGADEGTFQIEGIVQRSSDQNNDNSYLARTLLTRSLYIDQRVAGAGDWAVLGGYYMQLGDIDIMGDGKILLDVNDAAPYQNSSGCSQSTLLNKVGAMNNESIAPRIWPVLNRGLPTTNLFERGQAKDTIKPTSSKIRVWSFDDSELPLNPRCGQTTCVRQEDSISFEEAEEVNVNSDTIVIKEDDICAGSESFECHMYIEHMDLRKTKVLVETGSSSSARPVVIHLELPKPDSARINGLSGSIKLSGNSVFCGVNTGSTSCNGQPERFVLSAAAGTEDLSCDATSHVIDFSGSSLPHAIIHLRKGTVRPSSNANLHGMIWAQNICTSGTNFSLETKVGDRTVVEAANDLWQWSENGFPGYGQMVVRGIRGTGLDTFRRW